MLLSLRYLFLNNEFIWGKLDEMYINNGTNYVNLSANFRDIPAHH